MKMKNVLAVSVASAVLSGCAITGGENKDTEVVGGIKVEKVQKISSNDQVPSWYLNYPEDESDKVYAAASGLADDLQYSMAKSLHQAKVILGDKLSTKVGSQFKSFISDNGTGGTGKSIRESEHVSMSGFKDVNISGYEIENKAVFKDDAYYRSYILLSLDTEDREFVEETPVVVQQYTEADSQRAKEAYSRF